MFNKFHFITKILDISFFYNLYQHLVGCDKYLKRYSEIFIMPETKKYGGSLNLLDIGCGTGNIIKYLPENVNYTGIDYSENYINFDRKNFPQHEFIKKNAKESFFFGKKFNIIIAEALLLNFNDKEADTLFKSIINCAVQDCKIIISDTNYAEDLSFTGKFFMENERGKILRNKEQYERLISKYFNIENISEIRDCYRIPYNKIILECRLKQ